jgi:hypothetical protein
MSEAQLRAQIIMYQDTILAMWDLMEGTHEGNPSLEDYFRENIADEVEEIKKLRGLS